MTTIDTHATSAPATSGSGLAGVAEWITTTDHKRIGRLYLGASVLTFLAAGVVGVLLGIERISPTRDWLPVGSLTQLFSLERFGLTYLALAPLMVGLAVAIVPLQVGARSLTFPRLAAAGFWAWLIGAGLAIYSLVLDGGPGGSDGRMYELFVLATALTLAGLLATIISVVTTILTARAPGMNMRRVPFFTWSVLVASVVTVVALPVIIGDLLYLFAAHHYPSSSDLQPNSAFGRIVGFGFSQPTTILFAIPALGMLADTVATFTGKRLRPRGIIFTGIGLTGVGVFATVLQAPATIRAGFLDLDFGDKLKDLLPFAIVHLLPLLGVTIALGLAAKGLAAKPKISASLVFALFAGLNLFGAFAVSALVHIGDANLGTTVAEEAGWLCAVFAGVFTALAGASHWAPKWWGRTLPTKATLPLALLAFAGGELASLSLLIAGFADQPGEAFPLITPKGDNIQVIFDYSGPMGLWNVLNAVGIGLVLLAVLAFVALGLKTFTGSGDSAGDDPYDGQTLEWATTSPAPFANFADVHIVQSAEPLLDLKPSNRSDV